MAIGRRGFLGAAAAGLARAQTRLKRRPNVLVIAAGDLGWGDLSLHGNPYVHTSALDALAAQGTEFARFYVAPLNAPSRASLLTGRYSQRSNVFGDSGGREVLPREEITIARALKETGYRTALYGNWRLGMHYPFVPHAQGFDEFIGFRAPGARPERNGQPYPLAGYLTEALTAEAIRFLEDRPSPFLLWLDYTSPGPAAPTPERYLRRFDRSNLPESAKAAYALIAFLDDNVLRLLSRLDDLQLSEETAVIFLSTSVPAGERFNSGLRGTRGSVYEGGNRVPFFARWPGHIAAGRRVDRIAAHIDLYPTLLDLCRAPQPDKAPRIDGRSLALLMTEERMHWEDRGLFVHVERPEDPAALYPGTARTQRFNLVNGRELYDLEADPVEKDDVAANFPAVANSLRSAYVAWFRSVAPHGGFRRVPAPVGYAEENPVALAAEGPLSWEIAVARPGRYEARVRYECAAPCTGTKIELLAGGRTLSAAASAGAGVVTAGTLELRAGAQRIEVRAPALDVKELLLRRLE